MAKIIDSLVSDAVKRFVMNPEYMRAAWMREMENNILFGMTTDEMLVRGLGRDSHQLPHFAGVHVYPVFPGAAAQCVPSPSMPVAMHRAFDEAVCQFLKSSDCMQTNVACVR